MPTARPRVLASRTERTIVVARIALAASSLFAVWIDPTGQEGYRVAPAPLHGLYLAYAVTLAVSVWNRPESRRWPIVTHLADIAVCAVFQYLSLGPSSSPFFTYFVFSLFCAALRWGWRGTLRTGVLVLVLFLAMGVSMRQAAGPAAFGLNRFVVRAFYLTVVGSLLIVLGQHEVRLRREIERLARWPSATGVDPHAVLSRVLEHAAHIVGAGRALVAWEAGDEPWLHVAAWTPGTLTITRHKPGEIDPLIAPDIGTATILCPSALADAGTIYLRAAGGYSESRGQPVHAVLARHLGGLGVVSAMISTEHVAGRVFFSDLTTRSAELMALTEVVARELGASLEQVSLTDQLREVAASEQRLRVARDLHDGVLQSLTGIRLEIQNVATDLAAEPASVQRDRLLAIERTLAIEQRELRMFIDSLKPRAEMAVIENALLRNLDALRERVSLEWKVPVTIRVSPRVAAVPEAIEQAVPPMVHEAVVNALKHGAPSRIWVDVDVEAGALHIVVGDDGHGFPFRGRFGHVALEQGHLGPTSLRDRAASLGGELTIESEGSGSRVEIALPLTAGAA